MSAERDILGRLQRVPLFRPLPEAALLELARLVKRRSFPAGGLICRQGEPATELSLINSGVVELYHTDEGGIRRGIASLAAGECFGQMSLLAGEPCQATAVAVSPVELLVLEKSDFDRLRARNPQLERLLGLSRRARNQLRKRRFPGQEWGEAILSLQRRHPSSLVKALAAPLAILFWGLLLLVRFYTYWPILLLPSILLLSPAAAWGIWGFLSWRNDYFILTDRRIIHLTRVPFIYERRWETPLERIRGVTVARSLGSGDLVIEMRNTVARRTFHALPQAEATRQLIFAQLSRLESQAQEREREVRPSGGASPQAPHRSVPNTKRPSEGEARWRRHWFVLAWHSAAPLGLGVLGLLLLALSRTGLSPFDQATWRLPRQVLLALLLVLLGWLWWESQAWRKELYLLTDSRLIHWRARAREAHLEEMVAISYVIPHPLAWLLGFGHLTIETADSGKPFTFRYAPDPREVEREILKRMQAKSRPATRS